MADEEEVAGTEAEAEGAESSSEEGAEGADAGTEGAGEGEGDAGEDGKGDDANDKGKTEDKNKDDGEPQVRKKPIDFILERKDRKIAKLQGGAGKGGKSSDGAGEGDDEEADASTSDKKLILDTVMPVLEPLLKKEAEAADNAELTQFLSANKDFKPYEAKIKKYMAHPSRAHLPIKAIAYEVAGDDLLKIGALRAKVANEKADDTKTGGGADSGGGTKGVWDLTPEEFAAKQQEVRGKQR